MPSLILSLPAAIGLFFVLLVFLSICLSNISFQAHPAALMMNDPITNISVNWIKYIKSGFAIAMPQVHGHARSKAPVGLWNLPKKESTSLE